MKKVIIYTDGGCNPNPGRGAWAAILLYTQQDGTQAKKCIGDIEADTTNNRMELTAAVRALGSLKFPCRVTLRTDSQILCGILNRTGKKASKRANQDLVTQLIDLINIHEVKAEWVPGHSGVSENEECDQMCNRLIFKGCL